MLTAGAPRKTPVHSVPEGQDRTFIRRRAQAVHRLVRLGIRERDAEAWVDAWLASTVGLDDFRAAHDYWELAVEYAIEERRRGYLPPGTDRGHPVSAGSAVSGGGAVSARPSRTA